MLENISKEFESLLEKCIFDMSCIHVNKIKCFLTKSPFLFLFQLLHAAWRRLQRFVVSSLASVIIKKKHRDRELQKIFTTNR